MVHSIFAEEVGVPVDFSDSAERHWSDAEYLLTDSRLANADHLYGISAECSLKAVMIGLGMQVHRSGTPSDPEHRVHIDKLWDVFISFADERQGTRYSRWMDARENPFSGWTVAQRYHRRSDFRREAVENHQRAAKAALQALRDAKLDGVVP